MKILANILRFFISLVLVFSGIWYFTSSTILYGNDLSDLQIIIVTGVILSIIIAITIALSKFIKFGFEK